MVKQQTSVDSMSQAESGTKNYLNLFMEYLCGEDVKLQVIGSVIFVIYSYYLLLASIKGNSTYGGRTACFTYAPIT